MGVTDRGAEQDVRSWPAALGLTSGDGWEPAGGRGRRSRPVVVGNENGLEPRGGRPKVPPRRHMMTRRRHEGESDPIIAPGAFVARDLSRGVHW